MRETKHRRNIRNPEEIDGAVGTLYLFFHVLNKILTNMDNMPLGLDKSITKGALFFSRRIYESLLKKETIESSL